MIKQVENLKYKWLTISTVSIFVFLLFFFALHTRIHVSPDSMTHLDFAMHSVQNINLIGPATEDFPIEYMHFYNTGYGYHYFLHYTYKALELLSSESINKSFWVKAPFFPSGKKWKKKWTAETGNFLLIVRIISVLMTCLQVYILKRICEILQLDHIYPITLLWLSISIMFPFLHGNASRDVLVNLLSISFAYNVISFHIYRHVKNVKYVMLILAIAPFIQLSLCAFIASVLALYAFFLTPSFQEMSREGLKIVTFKKGYLFPIILGIIALPTAADLTNKIIRYKSIRPGCAQVFSENECEEKNATFRAYRFLRGLNAKEKRIPLSAYFSQWFEGLFARIFGIMGHKSYANPLYYMLLIVISLLFIISVILSIIYHKKNILWVGIISFFYFFIIFYFVNRQIYLYTGQFNAALQGRYVFPVYPLMIIFAHSCLNFLPRIGYYLYTLLLFGVLLFTYYVFLESPQFASIIKM